jgi:serine/threonine protein kinase
MKDEPRRMLEALPSCPGEDELLAFAAGTLDKARLAALEEHVDVCEACSRVMHAAMCDTVPVSGDSVATFQSGDLLANRYEILRYLVRGGMGEVYEALDRQLGQRVALKVVAPTKDGEGVRRLIGEVQLARRVSHPNVCRIHDFGKHAIPGSEVPCHFLTMEFVAGETLGQRLRHAGAVPAAEAHKLARELLLGLCAAHESGILHRDLKSENVMLRPTPDGGVTAVILDFGLARALERENRSSSVSRSLVGTFGYIAPEQLEGARYTPASDIYSFGVVWFEMLTGMMPFEAAASHAVTRSKSHTECPPPSRVNPAVPRELDGLVLRCLSRARQQRFGTAREVLDALDAVSGSPVPVPNRLRWAIVAALGASLLAGAWMLARPSKLPREPSVGSSTKLAALPVSTEAPASSGSPTLVGPSVAAASPGVVLEATTDQPQARSPSPTRTQVPTARPGGPAAPRARTTPVKAVTSAAAGPEPSPPAGQSPPGASSSPLRRPKPDWENPFGAVKPEVVRVDAARSPT